MKKTVHFDLNQEHSVTEGFHAWVFPIDHPSEFVSNKTLAKTSRVESLVQDGDKVVSFETKNTKYVGVYK